MRAFLRFLVIGVTAALMALLAAGCGSDDDAALPGVALPGDFPTGEVGLLDGTVLSASGDAAQGWSVTIQGRSNEGNALDRAVETLLDDGFEESSRATEDGERVVILSKDTDGALYWVSVGTISGAAGGPNSVFYQVSRD